MSSSFKFPPKLVDGAYETWKTDVEIWIKLTDLEKPKQALAIHLSLEGRARIASSEISADVLNSDDGVKVLINKLDGIFLADAGRRQFAAFHDLYNFRRADGVEVDRFISDFEHIYHKFSQQKMELPDSVKAFMLLAACNLNDSERQLVMSAITVVKYDKMAAALKRIFASEIVNPKTIQSGFSVKNEPVFEVTETADVLYTSRGRGRGRFRGGVGDGGRGRFGNSAVGGRGNRGVWTGRQRRDNARKLNPPGGNGQVSRCRICDSKFHWAKECPDAYENIVDTSNDTTNTVLESDNEDVYLSLFMGYTSSAHNNKLQSLVAESKGHGVLDTGCSTTVCGTQWYEDFVQNLSDYEFSKIKESESSSTFTFGDGVTIKSMKKVVLPCYIGNKRAYMTTDVIECNIPLLLSKKSMKNVNMVLNFKTDSVEVSGQSIELSSSNSGHYLLPLF